jgi:hypothetical protein
MPDRLEWESLLMSVRHELPQPVREEAAEDGSVLLVGGHPAEVLVRLTRSLATVSEFAVAWAGPDEAVVRPVVFGSVHWRRMPEIHALNCLGSLIRAARDARRARFRPCAVCGRQTAPEQLGDNGTCAECQGAA